MIDDLLISLREHEGKYPWLFLLLLLPYFFASIKLTPIFICQAINYSTCIVEDTETTLWFSHLADYVCWIRQESASLINDSSFFLVIILSTLNMTQPCIPPPSFVSLAFVLKSSRDKICSSSLLLEDAKNLFELYWWRWF